MKNKRLYTLWGLLFGLLFPVMALSLAYAAGDLSFTAESLWRFHRENYFLLIIELAPIVLACAGYIVGVKEGSALRKAEQSAAELRKIIEDANAPIIGVDLAVNINEWNQAAETLTGYKKEDVLGQRLDDRFIAEESINLVNAVFESAHRGEDLKSFEVNLLTPEGDRVELFLSATARRDADDQVNGVICVGQDLTETHEKTRVAEQANKLELIGSLTGGIAHDFNNLLSVIQGNVRILAEEVNQDDQDLKEMIEDTLSATQDGVNLNKQLLSFAKKQKMTPSEIDVNELVTRVFRLLERTMQHGVSLSLKCSSETLTTNAAPGRLESAIINLCINARDASEAGGEISVSTGVVKKARGVDGNLRSYVFISVADNGCGIKSEDLALVTEPFFTTKPDDQGTGLGLSMVRGMVDQAEGWLDISSEEGVGTEVVIYLPQLAAEPAPAAETVAQSVEKPKKDLGAILVVEDDERVKRFAKRCLEHEGYTVLVADSAESAMETLEARADIKVVFSDVIMPGGRNGLELASWLRAQHPKVKVQLTTGYEELLSQAESESGFSVLSKPYSQSELAEAIETLYFRKQ